MELNNDDEDEDDDDDDDVLHAQSWKHTDSCSVTHLNGLVPVWGVGEVVSVDLIGCGVYVDGSHHLERYAAPWGRQQQQQETGDRFLSACCSTASSQRAWNSKAVLKRVTCLLKFTSASCSSKHSSIAAPSRPAVRGGAKGQKTTRDADGTTDGTETETETAPVTALQRDTARTLLNLKGQFGFFHVIISISPAAGYCPLALCVEKQETHHSAAVNHTTCSPRVWGFYLFTSPSDRRSLWNYITSKHLYSSAQLQEVPHDTSVWRWCKHSKHAAST